MMLDRVHILRYVGSVLPEHHGSKIGTHTPPIENATSEAPHAPPGPSKGDYFTELYMIIVIILSTLLPLICIILSAVFIRKLWKKLHDHSSTAAVQREDTAQTSIKSSRELSGSRKSSRGGSRASKSDPNSRDQLLAQEGSIDNPLEEPIIVVDDEVVASISQEGLENGTTIDMEDDGGFGARAKFRNHSLKVDMEGSPHRKNHHRSYSDVGRNRRKSEQVEPKPSHSTKEVEMQPAPKSSNFLAAPVTTVTPASPVPGTKIRKSHSMRYRTEGSSPIPGGARSRVAQDDCMGNLQRATIESEIMITSPRLQHRRSPHHFHQQQHHPQVHQQLSQPIHQPQQSVSNHKQGHSPRPQHHSFHQPHSSHQQPHLSRQLSYSSHQQPRSSHQQLPSQRHYSIRRREPQPQPQPQLDPPIEPDPEMAEVFANLTVNQVEELIQQEEADTGNFGMTTSDLSLDDNEPSNPSYQYGNQPHNQYPPLNTALYYGGFYGYPVTTISYPSADTHQRRLVVTGHHPSGSSPTGDDEVEKNTGRKKSLSNAIDFPPSHEIRPMPVLSPRGLLSKQYSLPAAARIPKQLKGAHQRQHGSLRHDPAPQRLFDAAPTLTRHSSARERPSSSSGVLVARRTVSSGGQRLLASRAAGSFNLGNRSPQPPSKGGAISPLPRGHLSHSRTISSPNAHALPDDQLQHI